MAVACSTNSAADNCAIALRKSGNEKSRELGAYLRVGTRPDDEDIRENCWVGTLRNRKKGGEDCVTREDKEERERESSSQRQRSS